VAKKKAGMGVVEAGAIAEEAMVVEDVEEVVGEKAVIPEGYLPDYISGNKNVKDSPKEQVWQRIARALLHEYGISNDDMEADFSVTIAGKRKKLDIAIFHHQKEHSLENLSRVVVCRPEPRLGHNVTRLRDLSRGAIAK
jgi:type I restriction enzyme M protein